MKLIKTLIKSYDTLWTGGNKQNVEIPLCKSMGVYTLRPRYGSS